MLLLKMRVEEYLLEDGSSPYKKWVQSLDAEAAAKVAIARFRMKRGLISAIKWFDGIGEYVINWGPGYRIYLARDGRDLILLFGGGTKKGQSDDIKESIRLHEEYKVRKAASLKALQIGLAKNNKSKKGKKNRR